MKINVVTYNMGMGASRSNGHLPSKNVAFSMFADDFVALVGSSKEPWFLCVQEIDRNYDGHNQVEDMQSRLEKGTKLQWWKHSHTQEGSSTDEAAAIFSTRELVKVQRYSLSGGRVAVAVKAKLDDEKYMWVVDTHLLKGGSDPDGSTRSDEVQTILKNIVTFDPTVPVVLCGDFNVTDTAPGTYTGEADASVYENTVGRIERFAFSRGDGFVPNYNDITFPAWENPTYKLIDYIFVNTSDVCTPSRPVTINFIKNDGTKVYYASDHKGVQLAIDYP